MVMADISGKTDKYIKGIIVMEKNKDKENLYFSQENIMRVIGCRVDKTEGVLSISKEEL